LGSSAATNGAPGLHQVDRSRNPAASGSEALAFIPFRHDHHFHDFSISKVRHAAIFLRHWLRISLICHLINARFCIGSDWKGFELPQLT
jgi:hypothetical protein